MSSARKYGRVRAMRGVVVRSLAVVMLLLPAGTFAQPQPQDQWLVQGDISCPRIALLFNIGIGHLPSDAIFETLVEKDVPAMMFPMGSFAREHPEYLRRLDEAGFGIGTQGDSGLGLTDATDEEIRSEIGSSIDAIEVIIGRPIDPYHTPYAATTDERVRAVVASMGLVPVGWMVAAPDWTTDATEEGVYNAVSHHAYPGAIIELHLDGPATETSTALALPRLIDDLRARAFEFVTLGAMLEPCDAAMTVTMETITLSGLDVHGLHCKTAPSQGAEMLRILLNGDVVTPRGPAFDGWLPVTCYERDGWVKASALAS
jgi:peptidoglycan/xylan/chitin deacetylase (PgdA/CDA1 family)